MILVSVHPYQPKKIFLLILGVICFAVFPCLAEPVLMSVESTPYDRQMTRIQPVLLTKTESHGARNVRLVIGRRMPTSVKSHAWLEWTTDGGTYVLDPTINWAAYRS